MDNLSKTFSQGKWQAVMPPMLPSQSSAIRRPRSATRRAASSSSRTPATTAAAYSPRSSEAHAAVNEVRGGAFASCTTSTWTLPPCGPRCAQARHRVRFRELSTSPSKQPDSDCAMSNSLSGRSVTEDPSCDHRCDHRDFSHEPLHYSSSTSKSQSESLKDNPLKAPLHQAVKAPRGHTLPRRWPAESTS